MVFAVTERIGLTLFFISTGVGRACWGSKTDVEKKTQIGLEFLPDVAVIISVPYQGSFYITSSLITTTSNIIVPLLYKHSIFT